MDEIYFKKIMSTVILAALLVLTFLLVKPILIALLLGAILAFIFSPIYVKLDNYLKSPNISALIISFILALVILLPFIFLAPVLLNQAIQFYLAAQQVDFVSPIQSIFPSLASSEQFSLMIESLIESSTSKMINSIASFLALDNIINYLLKAIVVFFSFFFFLRDKDSIISYIKSLLPFSTDIEKKLFERSKGITMSVLYGQVVVGIIQGLFVGLGFFIFKIPNALFLTLLACLAGIFPIVGTTIIWIPVILYLLIAGNTFAAFGVIIFGSIASILDNMLKPIIVSQRTQMNSLLILIGMLGGFFLFGILGFILGPLILAYLLIILELYRNKQIPGVFTQEPKQEKSIVEKVLHKR